MLPYLHPPSQEETPNDAPTENIGWTVHPQVHAAEHDQEGPQSYRQEQAHPQLLTQRCLLGVVEAEVEPDVPGHVHAEQGMVGGQAPVLAPLQGHHGGHGGAWQAQQVLQKT